MALLFYAYFDLHSTEATIMLDTHSHHGRCISHPVGNVCRRQKAQIERLTDALVKASQKAVVREKLLAETTARLRWVAM
jgi:hypothetical protein